MLQNKFITFSGTGNIDVNVKGMFDANWNQEEPSWNHRD